MRDTLVFGTDHDDIRKECITKGNYPTFKKTRDIARTEEATQAQLRAMHAPVPPTQVDSRSETQKSPLKVIHPQTDRLGTQLDVNDAVITSNSEASDAQPAV